jgi:pilus assembly protein CpaB
MRAVFGVVLAIGLLLSGFAIYMVNGYIGAAQSELEAERQRAATSVDTVSVYAVTKQMSYGDPITIDDVGLILYAEPYLPEGTFQSEEELFPFGTDIVRYATRPMEVFEPILDVKVTEAGEITGITSLLKPGMRAFTIEVDASTGVSGFLRPGNVVDVYWTGSVRDPNSGKNQRVTQLIKSNLELIAVDQSANASREGASIARTVTAQVSPQDVAALAQAQASGSLSLSLVGDSNAEAATNILVNQSSLLGLQEAAIEAPKEKVCTIVQNRGTERIVIPIPCTN